MMVYIPEKKASTGSSITPIMNYLTLFTLAEIFGGKWIFGIGILMTSIFTVIMPWAAKTDLRLLVAVRVLEGKFFL